MFRLFIISLFVSKLCVGQNKVEEKYYNHFGDTLNTFESFYDLYVNIGNYSNTYKGKLDISKDTIYLDRVLDMNSLRRHHSSYSSKKVKDSLLAQKK